MLINLGEQLRKYNIEPKGIVHVGSHFCEEHDDYVSYGIKDFLYIEPCNDAFNKTIAKFPGVKGINTWDNRSFFKCQVEGENIQLFNCACGSENRIGIMYTSNNNEGQSNSLLEPNLHLEQHPEVVFDDVEGVNVRILDTILEDKYKYNILAMDVQGYEGEVLKGAAETLNHIDVVYSEVNRGSTYKDNMLIEDIDKLLYAFERVETYWPSPNWTWGDAVYIRKTLL